MSEIITAGLHRAVLRGASLAHSTNNKAEVGLGFEIVGEGDPDAGRFITDFNYPEASDISGDIFVEKTRLVGYAGDDLEEFVQLAKDGKLVNEVDLVVEHDLYNGKTNAKVKYVNRVGGGMLVPKNPMAPHEVKSFATRMKAKFKAYTGAKRSATPSATPRQGALPNPAHPNAPGQRSADEDVPF